MKNFRFTVKTPFTKLNSVIIRSTDAVLARQDAVTILRQICGGMNFRITSDAVVMRRMPNNIAPVKGATTDGEIWAWEVWSN